MKVTQTIYQHYFKILLIAICFMFCISIAGAVETALLENPFSQSSSSVFIGESGSRATQTSSSQGEYSLTLQADRTRVYYQGKIQFDAILIRTATNEPVKGETIIFKNLNDNTDTRRGVTNSYGKAVAGAYATLEPPQSEKWIAEVTINSKVYSSQPVSIQVLEFNAPTISSSDTQLYVSPYGRITPYGIIGLWPDVFSEPFFYSGDIFSSAPFFSGFVGSTQSWTLLDGWSYLPLHSPSYYPLYYPLLTVQTSETRPYFPMFGAPFSSGWQFPLFTS